MVREPASLSICTLLDRPYRRIVDIGVKYVGFEIPDTFVVGYGLDWRGRFRNLPYIATLKPEVFD
jgi:hypoxanthine phosphoribosyltransferase